MSIIYALENHRLGSMPDILFPTSYLLDSFASQAEGIVFMALYRYAFLAAGGGWADLPVDGSSAGGETASRSDIELVARLLERRHLGKKGTYHCVNFCLIIYIYI